MYQIERETVIADILEHAPFTAPLFQAIGMHCLGCVMASGENVEEACEVHGVDADLFVRHLNEFISTHS
ncbi:MAG: DUF1858 domain-containing protein [Oscillospiraceae bacterium]|nr:DUF1858 domain-containing protein [Oscillospiraceae bacterium]